MLIVILVEMGADFDSRPYQGELMLSFYRKG